MTDAPQNRKYKCSVPPDYHSKTLPQEHSLDPSAEHSLDPSKERLEEFLPLSMILLRQKNVLLNNIVDVELQIPIKKYPMKYFEFFSTVEKDFFQDFQKNHKNEKEILDHKSLQSSFTLPVEEINGTPINNIRSPEQINHVRTMHKLFNFDIIENRKYSEKMKRNDAEDDRSEIQANSIGISIGKNNISISGIDDNLTVRNHEKKITTANIPICDQFGFSIATIKAERLHTEPHTLITRLLKYHTKNILWKNTRNIILPTDLEVKNEFNGMEKMVSHFLNFNIFKDPGTLDLVPQTDFRSDFTSMIDIENDKDYMELELS